MGIIGSKIEDPEPIKPKSHEAEKSLCDRADEILAAITRLQALKIDLEYEIAQQRVLLSESYEDMRAAQLKRDEEIECIQNETKQMVIQHAEKYSTITKRFV